MDSVTTEPPEAAGAPAAPRAPAPEPAPAAVDPRSERIVRIEPGRAWSARLGELWEFRLIVLFVVWRDLKVRYRQTVFGALWALAQPLVLMLVFALVVGRVFHAPSQGVPYFLFAYAALVPWTMFSQTLTSASESLVRDKNLVSKVFFPRLALPLAAVISFLLDYAIAACLLMVFGVSSSVYPSASAVFWLPVLTLLLFAACTAVAVWLSALNVMYRDVRYAVPLLAQVWLFASPVAYGAGVVPHRWRLVYGLNPMAGIVDSFRNAALGIASPATAILGVSTAVTLVLLASGVAYFRRVERLFADVI